MVIDSGFKYYVIIKAHTDMEFDALITLHVLMSHQKTLTVDANHTNHEN